MALEYNLDDDRETLEAALALIDEWELEVDALSCSAPPPVAVPPVAKSPSQSNGDTTSTTTESTEDSDDAARSPYRTTATVNPRRRKLGTDVNTSNVVPTQMGRREELVFLRRKVRELEAVLTEVKAETSATTPESTSLDIVEKQQREQELDAAWVWQQIASRQLGHRQRAEHENLKLRVQCEEQIKIAKDLMRLLLRAYRRDDRAEKQDDDTASCKRFKRLPDAWADVTEEDQWRRVDELLLESDTLFKTVPFTGGPVVFRDVNVLEHVNGEMTVNVDSSWVVPFPVAQVMSAFWTHLMHKTHHQCDANSPGHVDRPDDGRDSIVTRYESNATASKFAGKFFGRFVARRIHAEDETPGIIIMDMSADPVGFKPMSMEGVRLHNQALVRVVWADRVTGKPPSPTPASPPTAGRMALIQMSQRLHVQLAAAETPTRRRRVGALTNFLMYNVEAELDWKQDLLETLLMRSVAPTLSQRA